MAIVFGIGILIHGALHLHRFVRDQGTHRPPPLVRGRSGAIGLVWIAAGSLFVVAGIAVVLEAGWWWMAGAGATLISQALVLARWRETRLATVANSIIAAGVILGYASWNYDERLKREIPAFLAEGRGPTEVITSGDLQRLPVPVRRWLERSGAIGSRKVRLVEARQHGRMRTGRESSWMPFSAWQYFSVDPPGFQWAASVDGGWWLSIRVLDRYLHGRGEMRALAFALFPVADARGSEIDQGSLVRYLAETVWFPTAALGSHITWEAVDSLHARGTMRFGGSSGTGMFTFTPSGDVSAVEALRYYDRNGSATMEQWSIRMDPEGYRTFANYRIPALSTVTWNLAEGEFTWLALEVDDVRYE